MKFSIVQNGEVLNSSGDETSVPWWSFTKLMIAAEVWRRDLDLEKPYRGRGGPFTFYTVKDLLTHRAGLPCYGPLPAYHEAVARGDTPWDADRFWEETQAHDLIAEPGSTFAYSNIGYMLLREMLEGEGAELPFAVEPLGGYDPAWVAHGLLTGTVTQAALALDELAHSDFVTWALSDQTQIGAIEGRPWAMPTYGLGVMADMGRAFGHTGQGPHSVFACYHFRRENITIAAFEEGGHEGALEQAVIDLLP